MRFLHTSDWHLGKDLFGFSLLEDQAYYLEKFCDLAQQEKVDAVIIAGDLYHRSTPPAEAVALLDKVFHRLVFELHIPVLAIAGNHDSPERLSFGSSLYAKSGLYISGTPQKNIQRISLQDHFGEVDFFLLPYLEPAHVRPLFPDTSLHSFEDAYRRVLDLPENQPAPGKRSVLLAHGLFSRLGENYLESDSERMIGGADLVDASIFDAFTYVALGHLHAPQKAGRENTRYSGSILKYSLSEASQRKGVLLVDIDQSGNVKIEEKSISPKRDLRILNGTLEDILLANADAPDTNDYIYANLTDPMLYDAMGKLRTIFPNTLGLKLDARREPDLTFDPAELGKLEKLSLEEHFHDFFLTFAGREMDNTEEMVMETIFSEVKKGEKH